MDDINFINDMTSSHDMFEPLPIENNIVNATRTSIDPTIVNCIVPLILIFLFIICILIIAIARLNSLRSNSTQNR